MSRRRGDRTMEVRPPRRRSENPRTVDIAQKRSKQESMGKARAGNVPTDRRDRGSAQYISLKDLPQEVQRREDQATRQNRETDPPDQKVQVEASGASWVCICCRPA